MAAMAQKGQPAQVE